MGHDEQLAECLEWKKNMEGTVKDSKPMETKTSLSNLWIVFFGVCGFMVLAMSIIISNVIANDNKARGYSDRAYQELAEAKLTAQKEHQEMMSSFRNSQDEIKFRLGKIEGALGVRVQ